jgi:DNA-binding transcriptional regulator GbsR (MarR family)
MIQIPQEVKDTFKEIGLGIAEQQVYVLLLQKGMLSIQEISNQLKFPRSSVHLACEELLKMGVVKVSVTGKRRSFYIENPKSIENFIEFKENDLKSKKLSLNSILPRLTAMYAISQDDEPIDIDELQGEEGFIKVFYSSLDQAKGGEVLRFGGDPTLFTVGRDQLKKYREERIKKSIFTRLLQPESPESDFEIKDARFKMREVRVLDKELYDPKINASVWGDNVAITVWDKGLHSIIIRNKAIAGFMKQLFEIAWERAKKE